MEVMDIKPEDIASVWGILDRNHNGKVDYDEFAGELFKMKAEDPHTLMVFMKYQIAEIQEVLQSEVARSAYQTEMLKILTDEKPEMSEQMKKPSGESTIQACPSQELVCKSTDVIESKLDILVDARPFSEMQALLVDISREISEKSSAVEDK